MTFVKTIIVAVVLLYAGPVMSHLFVHAALKSQVSSAASYDRNVTVIFKSI